MFILSIWKIYKCGKCLQSVRTSYLCLIRCASISRKTHYDTLGVKSTANRSEIRLAYLKACKKIHPDLNPNDPKSHEKFVLLSTAYNILSDKSSRRIYDNMIKTSSQGMKPVYGRSTVRPNTYRPRYENQYGRRESWDNTYYSCNYTRTDNFRSTGNTSDFTHPKANYTQYDKLTEFMTISVIVIFMTSLFVYHIIIRKTTSYMVMMKIRKDVSAAS